MPVFRCKECGQTGKFIVRTLERHEWLVGGDGDYLEDLECYDSEEVDVTCARCGSAEIERNT